MLRMFLRALLLSLTSSTLRSGEIKEPLKIELKGSWKITWADDVNNVNPLTVTKSGNAFEGSYINDAKETCKVTGQYSAPKGAVDFVIISPDWKITCYGKVVNQDLIEGTYLAYGTTRGNFKMTREKLE